MLLTELQMKVLQPTSREAAIVNLTRVFSMESARRFTYVVLKSQSEGALLEFFSKAYTGLYTSPEMFVLNEKATLESQTSAAAKNLKVTPAR